MIRFPAPEFERTPISPESRARAQAWIAARLETLGIRVASGHDAAHVGDADVVVISSAVRPTNPEVRAAISRQIRDAFYVDTPAWKAATYGRAADMIVRTGRCLSN